MSGPNVKGRAGRGMRVSVSATAMKANRLDATERTDKLDFSNFEGGGVAMSGFGLSWVEYTVGCDWDAGANPHDNPPGIYPRDDLGDLKLYMSLGDGTYFDMPQSTVLSARVSGGVRDKVGFEFSGESNGSYTRSTGSH